MKMYKKSSLMDAYKGIRKKTPPPSRIFDDGESGRPNVSNEETDDSADLYTLKSEATVACEIRGHTLGKWNDAPVNGKPTSLNKCVFCGKEVQVIAAPAPNEIDIGGEAVALGCLDNSAALNLHKSVNENFGADALRKSRGL